MRDKFEIVQEILVSGGHSVSLGLPNLARSGYGGRNETVV
jgi:hypothetical protein